MLKPLLLSDITVFRKILAITFLSIIISGCSTNKANLDKRDGYYANRSFNAVGQNERVRFLIFHYTALDDSQSLKTLTTEQVSAHYLIPTQPELKQNQPVILQLVDENKRAWHAGVSSWKGRVNLNDSSIGIEIVNKGYTDDMLNNRTWYPFTEKQITAIAALSKDIIRRYHIAPNNVLGHADIAPLRKQDPGKLFPWQRLAAMGIGAWPDKATVSKYLANRPPQTPVETGVIQGLLKKYGYDKIPQDGILDDNTRKTIAAFQMHFRPDDISGNPDAETEAIARALLEKYSA